MCLSRARMETTTLITAIDARGSPSHWLRAAVVAEAAAAAQHGTARRTVGSSPRRTDNDDDDDGDGDDGGGGTAEPSVASATAKISTAFPPAATRSEGGWKREREFCGREGERRECEI